MNLSSEYLTQLVVAIRNPEDAEASIPWVSLLARQLHLPLEFVSIVPPDQDPMKTRMIEATAGDYLRLLATDLRLASLELKTRVAVGPLEGELAKCASAQRGSMLVLSRGEHTDAADAMIEATTALSVPFMLVPSNSRPPATLRSVVVGNDRSPLAESVVRTSQTLAVSLGLAIIVVEAIEPESVDDSAYLAIQPVVSDRLVRVRGLGSRVILATSRAREAAVIVVGRHGAGESNPLTLGRTADWLSHHSDRPVVIVPEVVQ